MATAAGELEAQRSAGGGTRRRPKLLGKGAFGVVYLGELDQQPCGAVRVRDTDASISSFVGPPIYLCIHLCKLLRVSK